MSLVKWDVLIDFSKGIYILNQIRLVKLCLKQVFQCSAELPINFFNAKYSCNDTLLSKMRDERKLTYKEVGESEQNHFPPRRRPNDKPNRMSRHHFPERRCHTQEPRTYHKLRKSKLEQLSLAYRTLYPPFDSYFSHLTLYINLASCDYVQQYTLTLFLQLCDSWETHCLSATDPSPLHA